MRRMQIMSEVEFDHVACRYRLRPPSPTSSGGIATKRTMTGKGMNLDMNFDVMDTDEQSNDEDEKGSRLGSTMVYAGRVSAGVLPPKAASTDEDGSSRRTQ
jgi:hypothetical protein